MESLIKKFKNFWKNIISDNEDIKNRMISLKKGHDAESKILSILLEDNTKERKEELISDYKSLIISIEYLKTPIYFNIEIDSIKFNEDNINYIYNKYIDI